MSAKQIKKNSLLQTAMSKDKSNVTKYIKWGSGSNHLFAVLPTHA